ncbi:hypothetical protein DDZ13_15125 [Coraliomargarita sinensis]|uniref:Uncharacterized protein n=1 Tax=Coraliomargarita sinensis TaxID=2174842 RepID=A0A317ZER6_9BACT|nr:hypothetical protein [Coraliomargarita sinensis]PXA02827.1 hypothetical protein DDZ13_15125 [Coraliomargarita sinensis]
MKRAISIIVAVIVVFFLSTALKKSYDRRTCFNSVSVLSEDFYKYYDTHSEWPQTLEDLYGNDLPKVTKNGVQITYDHQDLELNAECEHPSTTVAHGHQISHEAYLKWKESK